MTVRFNGPGLKPGRIPFDQLLDVLSHFQEAIRHMVEDLAGRTPTRGPLPELIRTAGSLELVSTGVGSWTAEVALVETDDLTDFGPRALDEVVRGINQPDRLPHRVASEIADISKALTADIDSVEFVRPNHNGRAILRYQQPVEIHEPQPTRTGRTTARGRLLEVDWKDGTAELHTPTGLVRLLFEEAMGPQLQRFARRVVSVSGDEERTVAGQRRLTIDSLAPSYDDEAFWNAPTPQALVASQGVTPFEFPGEPHEARDDGSETVDQFLAAIFE